MSDILARKLVSIARNGDEWTLQWSQGTQIFTLKSNEAPDPLLGQEMAGLHKYALEAAPWISKDYKEKSYVAAVKFDWKGDDNRRNAVVTVGITNKPIKIPTEKKLADNNLDEKKKGRWDTNAVAQFDKVEEQAFAYIDGRRAQMDLPIIQDDDENKTPPLFDSELENEGGNDE